MEKLLEGVYFAFTLMIKEDNTFHSINHGVRSAYEQDCLFHHIGVFRGGVGRHKRMVSSGRLGMSGRVSAILEQKMMQPISLKIFTNMMICRLIMICLLVAVVLHGQNVTEWAREWRLDGSLEESHGLCPLYGQNPADFVTVDGR
ncbi:MAG: hypothetical protein J6T46_03930, partial [Victivallales bacterium]|nr:hypothetical protein [Victivallales bacterium]